MNYDAVNRVQFHSILQMLNYALARFLTGQVQRKCIRNKNDLFKKIAKRVLHQINELSTVLKITQEKLNKMINETCIVYAIFDIFETF